MSSRPPNPANTVVARAEGYTFAAVGGAKEKVVVPRGHSLSPRAKLYSSDSYPTNRNTGSSRVHARGRAIVHNPKKSRPGG
jgi:hypothetical protein